jgi:hypothetical protein
MVDQRGLSNTGPGNDIHDIHARVCPGRIQKRNVLLSTEKIASCDRQPRYGNILRSQFCSRLASQAGGTASGQLSQALIREGLPFVDGTRDCRYELQKLGGSLKALLRIFLEEHRDEGDSRLRNTFEPLKRQRSVLMFCRNLEGTTPKWHLTSQHLPKRYTQRVEIRTDIHLSSHNLFRTGELWRSRKGACRRDRGLSTGLIVHLGQTKIDDFCGHRALLLNSPSTNSIA